MATWNLILPRLPVLTPLILLSMVTITMASKSPSSNEPLPRTRDLGLSPGILSPGPHNAITDVPGVLVGHRTLIEGNDVRTGVTAILPHGGNLFQEKVPAAVYVGNGFGKAAGFLQVQELGVLETPIVLTNTLSVGTAIEAVVAWTLNQPGNEEVYSVNAVVGETNDSYLNDIRGMHVTSQDIIAAIETAASGPVEEGSVGAGTGTRAFGWKGGIGTASRVLPPGLGGYTMGALVQSNYGGILTIDGHPVGVRLGRYSFQEYIEVTEDRTGSTTWKDDEYGSCMVILATDAPVSPRSLERLAKRAILGLARTGSFMSNGSGDFVIAFSTQNRVHHTSEHRVQENVYLRNEALSPLFLAVVESVEEAVYNSLLQATTVTGHRGNRVEALPINKLQRIISGNR